MRSLKSKNTQISTFVFWNQGGSLSSLSSHTRPSLTPFRLIITSCKFRAMIFNMNSLCCHHFCCSISIHLKHYNRGNIRIHVLWSLVRSPSRIVSVSCDRNRRSQPTKARTYWIEGMRTWLPDLSVGSEMSLRKAIIPTRMFVSDSSILPQGRESWKSRWLHPCTRTFGVLLSLRVLLICFGINVHVRLFFGRKPRHQWLKFSRGVLKYDGLVLSGVRILRAWFYFNFVHNRTRTRVCICKGWVWYRAKMQGNSVFYSCLNQIV